MSFSRDILKISAIDTSFIADKDMSEPVIDSSLFTESLRCVYEENVSFINMISEYNTTLNEGFISNKLKEHFKKSISKFNPLKIIDSIISKFIEIMETLFNKFKSMLLYLFNESNTINLNRNKLKNLNKAIPISKDLHIYTNLRVDTAPTSYRNELETQSSILLRGLQEFRLIKRSDEIYDKVNFLKDEVNVEESYFDSLRGRILGTSDGSITKDEFVGKLYNYFRNGGAVQSDTIIQPEEIINRLTQFDNYRRTLDQVNREKMNVTNVSRKVKNDINRLKLVDYIPAGLDATENATNLFNSIIQSSIVRIKNICDIYLHFYGAKMDALKEEFQQNKYILNQAVHYAIEEDL